ncbi:hypothetical protein RI367_002998 [Sorochytrium milnesiophthora]
MPATTIVKLLLAVAALLACTSAAPLPEDPAPFFDSAHSTLKKHTERVHDAGTLDASSNDRELHPIDTAPPAESHNPWTVVEHKPVGDESSKIHPADAPPFCPELPRNGNRDRRVSETKAKASSHNGTG